MHSVISKTIRARHYTGVQNYVAFFRNSGGDDGISACYAAVSLEYVLENYPRERTAESREVKDLIEIPKCEAFRFHYRKRTILTHGKKEYVLEESEKYNISLLHLLTKPELIFPLTQLKATQAEGRLEALLMSPELKQDHRREYNEQVFSGIVDRIHKEYCKGLVRLPSGKLSGYRVDSSGVVKMAGWSGEVCFIDKDTLEPITLGQRGQVKHRMPAPVLSHVAAARKTTALL